MVIPALAGITMALSACTSENEPSDLSSAVGMTVAEVQSEKASASTFSTVELTGIIDGSHDAHFTGTTPNEWVVLAACHVPGQEGSVALGIAHSSDVDSGVLERARAGEFLPAVPPCADGK